mmetsp:Transcript_26488/g.84822  ORF Transcript_26488/g.84822 Transcript_26488/m.84822 type:complete len:253 (+) Transcript_26488:579-1337(+)
MQLLWATTTPAATVRRGRVPPPSFYCDNIDNFGPQVRSLYHDGHQFPQLLRPQPSVLGHRPQQDLPLRALQVPVLGEGQVRLAQGRYRHHCDGRPRGGGRGAEVRHGRAEGEGAQQVKDGALDHIPVGLELAPVRRRAQRLEEHVGEGGLDLHLVRVPRRHLVGPRSVPAQEGRGRAAAPLRHGQHQLPEGAEHRLAGHSPPATLELPHPHSHRLPRPVLVVRGAVVARGGAGHPRAAALLEQVVRVVVRVF